MLLWFYLLEFVSSSRNQMIRLNLYCSLLTCPSHKVKDHRKLIRYKGQKWNRSSSQRIITSMALKDEMDGRFSNLPGQSWEPGLETAVPFEQRPVCLGEFGFAYAKRCFLKTLLFYNCVLSSNYFFYYYYFFFHMVHQTMCSY